MKDNNKLLGRRPAEVVLYIEVNHILDFEVSDNLRVIQFLRQHDARRVSEVGDEGWE